MSDLKEWPFPPPPPPPPPSSPPSGQSSFLAGGVGGYSNPPPPRLLLAGDMVLWGMVGLVDEGIGSVYFKDSVGWERGVWGV